MPYGKNVDQRVVEMRIDNQNFESGAKQTISTLEKLENALHLKGDNSALDEMQRSVNNFSTSNMLSELSKITAHLTIVSKVTGEVFGEIEKKIKEFTVEPIGQGFDKFGKKTQSVATLMAQGFGLDEVEEQLERLMWFTDETSYNFTDMVDNISKFTASGQGLTDSVTAMEGIALWAALSGQGAAKASQAMYQLSQAMSKGALRYDDWKSVQNAGMDNKEFREQAVKIAEDLGILKKTAEDTWEVVGTPKGLEKAEKAAEKARKHNEAEQKKVAAAEKKNRKEAEKAANAAAKWKTYTPEYTEYTPQYIDETPHGESFSLRELFTSDALTGQEWLSDKVMMEVFERYAKAASELQRYMDEVDADNATEAIRMLKDEAEELASSLGITLDEAFQQLGYDIDEFSLKAFEAGQQARSWADVVDSVKDAVSTGWMKTFEIIFGKAEEAIEFWSNLAEKFWTIFASGGERRNSILEIAFGRGKAKDAKEDLDGASSSMSRLNQSSEQTGRTVSETGSSMEQLGQYTEETSKSFENLIGGRQENAAKSAVEETIDAVQRLDVATKNAAASTKNLVKYSKYKHGNWDEDSYFGQYLADESKRIAGTNFFSYTNPTTGRSMLLEEDMKWVLPEGVSADAPEIIEAISKWEKQYLALPEKIKDRHGVWQQGVNSAILGAVEELTGDTAQLQQVTESHISFTEAVERAGVSMTDLQEALLIVAKEDDALVASTFGTKSDHAKELTQTIKKYGGVQKAIKAGAISFDELSKAMKKLGVNHNLEDLSDLYETVTTYNDSVYQTTSSTKTFEEILAESGKTMADFEDAMRAVSGTATDDLVDAYGSIEEALKNGGVSAEQFRKALELLGISDATGKMASDINVANKAFKDYRETAMKVLRGDYGNGEERKKRLEALGYDYETVQWLAGNLNWMYGQGWDITQISDDYLLNLAKPQHVQDVLNNLGQVNSAVQTTDQLLESLQDDSVPLGSYADNITEGASEATEAVEEATEKMMTGAEYFEAGIYNILDTITDIQDAYRTAVNRVFGGLDEETNEDKAFERLGNAIKGFLEKFYNFTEAMKFQTPEELEGLTILFEGLIKLATGFGKVLGFAGGIAMKAVVGLRVVFGKFLEMLADLRDRGVLEKYGQAFQRFKDAARVPLEMIGNTVSRLFQSFEKSALPVLFEKLAGWIERLGDRLLDASEGFDAFMRNEDRLNKFSVVLESVRTGIENIWASLFSGDGESVSVFERLGSTLGTVQQEAENVWKALTGKTNDENLQLDSALLTLEAIPGAIDNVNKAVGGGEFESSPLLDFISQVSKITDFLFSALFGDTAKLKTSIGNFLDIAIQTIQEKLANIKPQEVFDNLVKLVKTAGFSLLIFQIQKFISSFSKIGDSINTIPQAISGTIKKLGKIFDNVSDSIKANMFTKMAIAIIALAGALWVLSKIPEDKLTHAAVVLGLLMYALSKFAGALGSNKFSFMGKNSGNTSLSNSQNLNVKVLPELAATLIAIGALILSMAWILVVAKRMDTGKFITIMATIAVVVMVISAAVNKLANLKIADASGFIASVLALALALNMLMIPMALMALMPYKMWLKAIAGLLILMVALGGLIAWMSRLDNSAAGDKLLKVAVSMIGVAAAILMLMPAVLLLAAIPTAMLWKGIGALTVLVLILGLMTTAMAGISLLASGKGGSKDGGMTLIKVAAAILILVVAIDLLLPAVVTMVAVFAGLLGLVSKMKNFETNLKKMAKLAGVLMLFGVALIFVGVGAFFLGVGLLAAGVGVLAFAVGAIAMAAAVDAVAAAIPKFVEGLAKAGTIIKENWKELLLLAGTVLVLSLAIAGILALINKITGSNIGSTIAGGLSRLGTNIITGIVQIVSTIGTKLIDAWPSILKILGFLAITAGLYLLGLIPDLTSILVQGFITLVQSFADALRNNKSEMEHAVWSVVEVILEIAVDAITWLGSRLIGFAVDLLLMPIRGVLGWISKALQSVGREVPDWMKDFENFSMTDYLTEDYEAFSEKSSKVMQSWLIPPVKEAEKTGEKTGEALVKGYREGAVEGVNELKELLPSSTNLNGETFEGRSKPTGFLEELLGGDSSSIGEGVKDILGGAIENVDLTEEAKGLGIDIPDGAKLGVEGNLDSFTNAVSDMGLDGLDMFQTVNDSHSPSREYQKLAEEIPEGAKLGIEQNEHVAVEAVAGMANHMLEEIHSHDAEYANAGTDAANIYLEAYRTTLNSGNFSTLEDPPQKDLDEVSLRMSAEATKAEMDRWQILQDVQQLQSDIQRSTYQDAGVAFSDMFPKWDEVIRSGDAESAIGELDSTIGTGLDNTKKTIDFKAAGMGKSITEGVAEGIEDPKASGEVTGAIETVSKEGIEQFKTVNSIRSPSEVYAFWAKFIPEGIAFGLKRNAQLVTNAVNGLAKQMLYAFRDMTERFPQVGRMAGEGLVSGVRANQTMAYNAGAQLGRSVESGFRASLGIRSPSRVFAALAEYIPEGVSQGIENNEDTAIQSIVVFSNELVEAIMQSMAKVDTIADDTFTYSPEITPVVDFNNLDAASRSVSNLSGQFSNVGSLGLNMNELRAAQRISSELSGYYADSGTVNEFRSSELSAQNREIVSELRSLRGDLDQMTAEITSMKVVLNTGVLVGELAPGMNTQLGRLAERQRRQ